MEWKKGNTFGTTAFISYGSFWLTLVIILLLRTGGAVTAEPSSTTMAVTPGTME